MSRKTSRLSCRFKLPQRFRSSEFLAFHRRDAQEIAERVTETTVLKGLCWEGLPACLTLRIDAGQAEAILEVDGAISADSSRALENMARRMLGITQKIEVFEAEYADHPELGVLIRHTPGLRVPQAATPFEALSWAITGQQISVAAAVSLRRKLILAAGVRHSSGLACYPDARILAATLREADLRTASFSQAKARTLLNLAGLVADGTLPLDTWIDGWEARQPVEHIQEELLKVRGIGPWTISYAMLRGFGWLDGSLHGDVAVRRGLQSLLGSEEKPNADYAQQWLAQFSPWRALVGAHLWALQTIQA